MTHEQWSLTYRKYQNIADRVARMRNDRARQACKDAGLDPSLLGIHPHNAMCSFQAGHPWPEVDYSKVRLCLRILASEFDADRIVERWDRRVRGIA